MSQAGWLVAEAIGRPIGSAIERGKPLAVILGSLLGAASCLGTCAWISASSWGYYIGFGLLGGIVGALIGGLLFPEPMAAPPDYRWIGEYVFSWETTISGKTSTSYYFYALTENALLHLYKDVGMTGSVPSWLLELQGLQQGEPIESSVVNLRRLSELDALEMRANDQYLTLLWRNQDGIERSLVDFPSVEDRTDFVEVLSKTVGKELEESQREMTFFEATFWPFFFLALATFFVGGAIWLSYHWTHHPPRPPIGKPKGDELVLLLVWAGPLRVALVGAIPFFGVLGWTMKRIMFRPLVNVLSLRSKGVQRTDGKQTSRTHDAYS